MLAISAVSRADYAATVLEDSPLHYFRFEEVAGTTFADLGSASALSASAAGGVSANHDSFHGVLGRAISLDGNAGTFVEIPPFHPGDSVTVEAWAMLDTDARPNDYHELIARWYGSYALDVAPGDIAKFVALNSSGTRGDAAGAVPVSRGKWHHFVGVYSGGQLTVWVDGQPGPTISLPGVLQNAGSVPDRILIGASGDGVSGPYNWKGRVDEVAFYNYALSPERIIAHREAVLSQFAVDSEAQFSAVQGYAGWYHGYRDLSVDGAGTYTPAKFIPFPLSWWNATYWDHPGSGAPYTSMGPTGLEPNDGPEHWPVRRWVASGLSGLEPLALTYDLRKLVSGGNGVTGNLYVNGFLKDTITIAGEDTTGVTRTYYVHAANGQVIDFAVTPNGSSNSDVTYARLRVSRTIPANPQQPDGAPFDPALPVHLLDDNNNGISDLFERLHSPSGTLDPNADDDGDGATNFQEYLLGLNPNVSDFQQLLTISRVGSVWKATWPTVAGLRFQLLATTDLSTWDPVGGYYDGTGSPITVDLPTGPSEPKSFYRLRAVTPLDLDGDGLNAYEEAIIGSSDTNSDSDGDEVFDFFEARSGTNPAENDLTFDLDGDRVPNIFEIARGTRADLVSSVPPADIEVDATILPGEETATRKRTFSGGLAAAPDLGIVRVLPGFYSENNTFSPENRRVLILGDQGASPPTISVFNQSTTLRLNNLAVVDNLRISSGANFGITKVRVAMPVQSFEARFVNCLVGEGRGTAAFIEAGTAIFDHCTVRGNFDSATGQGISVNSSARLRLRNSIVWNLGGLAPWQISASAPSVTVQNSIIKGAVFGGLGSDPQFDRYGQLLPSSPAINAGATTVGLPADYFGNPRDVQPDIGHIEMRDTDSDGLPDWWEIAHFGDLTKSGGDDSETPQGDGLLNSYEYRLGLNPLATDSDGDGIPDLRDAVVSTNDPYYPVEWTADSDSDGLTAGWELAHGSSDANADSNGDGIRDGVAARAGFNPAAADPDGDGLNGAQELALGTNPLAADSDGDGVNDALDAFPLDPSRSSLPPGTPGDVTPPVITLEIPHNAVPIP